MERGAHFLAKHRTSDDHNPIHLLSDEELEAFHVTFAAPVHIIISTTLALYGTFPLSKHRSLI